MNFDIPALIKVDGHKTCTTMPTILRFSAIFAFAVGLLTGLTLVVAARPVGPQGQVHTIFILYALGAVTSGLLWSGTWWAIAEVLETNRAIFRYLRNDEAPAPKNSALRSELSTTPQLQKDRAIPGRKMFGIVFVIVGLSAAVLVILSSL